MEEPVIDLRVKCQIRDIEKQAVLFALSQTDYNAAAAAKMLGIALPTIYRKMRQYLCITKRKRINN